MSFSIGGLASGIDTAALVQSLMQAERIPQLKLQRQQQDALKAVTSWNDLRTRMQAIQTAAENLATPAKALGSVATSSDDKTVKATATASASPGQYSVKVDQIATAQQRVKADVGPLSMTVGAGRTVLTAGTRLAPVGTETMGAFTMDVDWGGAAAGVQNVAVTRASAPAAAYGNLLTSLSATDLTVAVDGGAATGLTLQSSYSDTTTTTTNPDGSTTTTTRTAQENLLKDLNDQLAAKGIAATASAVGGRLQIATTGQGSARTLQLGGGAATALGLPTTVSTGQAALVTVNGKSQEVEPEGPGTTTPRSQALGDSGIVLKVGSSIALGSMKANVVVTTDTTTLADLQGLLNTTGSPVSAAVVAQNGTNTLVLSSTATGKDGEVSIPADTPLAALRDFTSDTRAKNALATVNGVAVQRSSNTLTEILPGLSLDLLSKPSDDLARTVTVSRDSTGTVDKAKALVDAMNAFVNKVTVDTRYDVKSRTGGPLVGDSAARSLSATLFQKAGAVIGTPGLRALSQLGIETTRDGKFELKSDVLTKALAADPDAVGKVLSEFAGSVAEFAKSSAQTGGLMTGRRDGAQSDADARQKQADAMEVRLGAIEKRYKATYAAMETALARLKSQGGAMTAALSSFTSTRN